MTRLGRIFLIHCVLATLACSASNGPGGTGTAGASGEQVVVARVEEREITLAEVDSSIAGELYEARARALEGLINEAVVEHAATLAGVAKEQLIEQQVAERDPISDEAVAAFFEERKPGLPPEQTLELLAPSIRNYLEHQERQEVIKALLDAANIELLLEAPRVQVAADGPSLGPDTAPITIVEFSDYQCPFCGRSEPTIQEVLKRYPEQVRLVFRHFPIDSIHPHARGASEAAVCADAQERFWDFHALLFENQGALGEEDLNRYAQDLGLDMEAFASCRADAATAERVARDSRAGAEAGVRGTPAFFLNGILLSGAVPIDQFVDAIDKELARTSRGS